MAWLVDLISSDDDRSGRAPIAIGFGLLGVLLLGGLVATSRRKPLTESDARAAYMRSLREPESVRAAAKARWDELRAVNEVMGDGGGTVRDYANMVNERWQEGQA